MPDNRAVRTRNPHLTHHTRMSRLLTIAVALTTPLAAQSLDETFARMDKTAQQLKTVVARIKRDVHTSVINDDSIDSGTIKLKRQKSGDTRMLIDFTGTDAKTVALEDSKVSVYYPRIKTAQIYDVGDKKQAVEQFLLLGFGASSAELKQAYDVKWVGPENIGGQQTGHLQLNPKSKEMSRQVTGAELWIADGNGLPIEQKIVFTSGDYWLVNYSDIKFNQPLSDEDLKLKIPKDAQIQHPRL
jgi:outer membrane lipoprotein-sorting protein